MARDPAPFVVPDVALPLESGTRRRTDHADRASDDERSDPAGAVIIPLRQEGSFAPDQDWVSERVTMPSEAADETTAAADAADVVETVRPLFDRAYALGVRSLPVVCMVGAAVGAAMVLQGTMAPTPPSAELGRMFVVVVLRELAPLLTTVVVAGRIGSVMARDYETGAEQSSTAGVVLAVLTLAIHFAVVAMVAAFCVSSVLTLRTFDAVRSGLQQELAWFDLPLFAFKTIGLGVLVAKLSERVGRHVVTAADAARALEKTFSWALLLGGAFSIGVTVLLYLLIGAPPPP